MGRDNHLGLLIHLYFEDYHGKWLPWLNDDHCLPRYFAHRRTNPGKIGPGPDILGQNGTMGQFTRTTSPTWARYPRASCHRARYPRTSQIFCYLFAIVLSVTRSRWGNTALNEIGGATALPTILLHQPIISGTKIQQQAFKEGSIEWNFAFSNACSGMLPMLWLAELQ